jgi:hypothetical protein
MFFRSCDLFSWCYVESLFLWCFLCWVPSCDYRTGGAAGAGGAATTTSQAVMQAQQSRSSKKINYDALKVTPRCHQRCILFHLLTLCLLLSSPHAL